MSVIKTKTKLIVIYTNREIKELQLVKNLKILMKNSMAIQVKYKVTTLFRFSRRKHSKQLQAYVNFHLCCIKEREIVTVGRVLPKPSSLKPSHDDDDHRDDDDDDGLMN